MRHVYHFYFIMFLFADLNLAIFAQSPPCFDGHPDYHFSPEKFWTNDPNGLLFVHGKYHLFYQYNPFGNEWGHMSWGHAVSTDLLSWQHLPVAIPEESVMIFSGSAVYDSLNTSGLGDQNGCLVAIYTAHQSSRQAQHIAFSLDWGMTWKNYDGNPVLDREMADFRDPKVFWYAPGNKWVMVVALPKENKVAIYSSPDLKKWTWISEFGPEGKTGGLWECPDLFEVPILGEGNGKWILLVSSPGPHPGHSSVQYFIGNFDGTTFVNMNPPPVQLFLDAGKDFYAAQTYNGLPRDRRILLAWMSNWSYAGESPEVGFRGRMTLPRRLTLAQTSNGLRLHSIPLVPFDNATAVAFANASADSLNHIFANAPEEKSFLLKMQVSSSFSISLGENADFLSYDPLSGKLIVNRNHASNCFSNPMYATRDEIAVNESRTNLLRLSLYFDSNSMELFVYDGELSLSYLLFPGIRLNLLRFRCQTAIPVVKYSKLDF